MKWYVVIGWERPGGLWRPRSVAITQDPKREGAILEAGLHPPEVVHAHGPYKSADVAQAAVPAIEAKGPSHRATKRLTLAVVREEARRLGFTVKSRDGEFLVTPMGQREGAATYYTNDLEDALGTMRAQSRRRWEDLRASGKGGGYEPLPRTTRYVHKGYTLIPDITGSRWYIVRGGVNIGSAETAQGAEEIVNDLS